MSNRKNLLLIALLSTVLIVGAFTSSAIAEWKPAGPIKLIATFRPGGGVDTQARLIAEEMQRRHGWKIIPENIAGKGGINGLRTLKKGPNDGTVIAMTASEALGYNMIVSKKSGLKLDDFTGLTTTALAQMGIVAMTKNGWKTFHDIVAIAKKGQKIRFGAMSQKLADIAYLLGKAQGVQFNIVSVRGGRAVMNGLNAGDLDVGFVAGIQAKAVRAGDMVNLASGMSFPLTLSPNAPLMTEFGVQFNGDAYFMFAAPAGIPKEAEQAIVGAIAEIVHDPSTKAGGYIKKAFGKATTLRGAEFQRFLEEQYQASHKLLKAVSQ
jgi:tripartite-type tricarboxylate transporter receptor subunit TctC